jgi:hypothetical protein
MEEIFDTIQLRAEKRTERLSRLSIVVSMALRPSQQDAEAARLPQSRSSGALGKTRLILSPV